MAISVDSAGFVRDVLIACFLLARRVCRVRQLEQKFSRKLDATWPAPPRNGLPIPTSPVATDVVGTIAYLATYSPFPRRLTHNTSPAASGVVLFIAFFGIQHVACPGLGR